jgi:uncharacterized protein with HEPN domain
VKSDRPYLAHIADAISAIQKYVMGGRDTFLSEQMIQDAVIRNFEIIGEAAARLSPELRDAADIPWARVVAFRNRLIHGYWSVDIHLVWDVIEHELPPLKTAVEQLLSELDPNGTANERR